MAVTGAETREADKYCCTSQDLSMKCSFSPPVSACGGRVLHKHICQATYHACRCTHEKNRH